MFNRKLILLIFFNILILIILIAGIILWKSTINTGIALQMSDKTVIKQIQSLNRLETSTFTIEKVIDTGMTGSALKQILFGDRILLIANGQVIAGFDLSSVGKDNVNVDGTTLRLMLPPPIILVSKLDSKETRVYDRKKGILTQGNKDLESQARFAAEDAIRKAACDGDILGEASKNAKAQLTTFFKTAGFTTVIIDIPQGSC